MFQIENYHPQNSKDYNSKDHNEDNYIKDYHRGLYGCCQSVKQRSLYEELINYLKKGHYPFHMPGHKGNPAFLPPTSLINLDVTELDNTDNLHNPTGCIKETQRRIAEIYGADESFLLVGGSTSGIIAAICATCEDGSTLAVDRNCHRAVYSGMLWSGVRPVYFWADSFSEKRLPKAKVTIVTSPTYEGNVLDIAAIAESVHKNNGILIVDEAHGAHFPFHPAFPQGALAFGADIVIHSLHKTLPAFSQSAAIHVQGAKVDRQRLRQILSCTQTSSPSYLIMATTDYMLNKLKNPIYFEEYVENLLAMRKEIKDILLPTDDIGKLLLTISNGRGLSKKHKLAFELITDDYTLAMTSVADTLEGFNRLKNAVKGVYEVRPNTADQGSKKRHHDLPLPEVVLSPREAMGKKTRKAKLKESIGEISGSLLAPFPPGIPVLVPGERISESLAIDCEIDILLI